MKKIMLSLMTSGFHPKENAITQILVKVNGEEKGFNKYIIPYAKKYDSNASEKTGLNESFLSENGVSLEDGLFGLKKFIFDNCGAQYTNKPLLMGYKIIDFDISFLKEAKFDINELVKFKVLDLYHVVFGLDDVGFFKKRGIVLKNHKLHTVCHELGVSTNQDGVFDKIKAIEGLYNWLREKVD